MNDIIKKLFGLKQKELILLLFFLTIFVFLIYSLIVILIEEKKLFKQLKKYKIIEKHKQEILLILILPIIFFILVCFGLIKFESWLGFFGGYFGVLGAFGAVWWQLYEEKRKKKKELLLLNNENLYSFLISTKEISCKFFIICSTFLKNISNGDYVIYSQEMFNYDKEIFLDLFKNNNIKVKRYILLVIDLFSTFVLKDIKLLEKNKKIDFNENRFYLEQLEIFFYLNKELEILIKKIEDKHIDLYSEDFIKIITKHLDFIEKNIDNIEESYPSYFEEKDISVEEIRNRINKYKI